MSSSPQTDSPSKMRSMLKIILPAAVLLLGAGATAALISSRKAPEPASRPTLGALVETIRVQAEDLPLEIEGRGEVTPKTRIEVLPEVTGRVVEISPNLVSGGRFRAGQTLIRIDPRNYELAVERARAAVARTQVVLEREQAEAAVATAEWEAINGSIEPPPLVARKPQTRQAEAELAAANADLATAELALERTRITVPFDGLVIQETVDLGQLVSPGRSVAKVIGTDAVEIRVPLEDSELAWFDLPAPATVSVDFAGRHQSRPAEAERLEGQVDPRSRMVHVVIRVDQPFDREVEGTDSPPLMPGTFVRTAIHGETLQQIIQIPRSTLRGSDQVWVVEEDRLRIRTVEVLRAHRDSVVIREGSGLDSGDLIVTSAVEAATDGMAVRMLAAGDPSSGDGSNDTEVETEGGSES